MTIFTLADGRRTFHQWDTGRQLIVHDTTCNEVHFCNGSGDGSLVCKVKAQDELRVVNVPNILLQDTRSITAFAFVEEETGGYTRRAVVFPVRARTKPEDYVYTEEERLTWASLDQRITDLEKNGGGGGSGGNVDFQIGETLKLENGILSVNTTNNMEQDNTLPITSAGVYATVGNIEALLKTI